MGATNPVEVRRELQAILNSQEFSDSRRLRGMLRFLVEEWLEGREGDLKESVLGVKIFGRPADWDSQGDAIVRVQIRNLRLKLGKYYESEGAESALVLEIPKGSYVPTCVARGEADGKWSPWLPVGAAAAVVVLAAMILLWWAGTWPPDRSLAVVPFEVQSSQGRSPAPLDEELVTLLGRIPTLQVTAVPVAEAMEHREDSPGRRARQLHARYILDGSMRLLKSGPAEEWRISARLTDSQTGYLAWSGETDRLKSELNQVPAEFAAALSVALGVSRGPMTERRSANAIRAQELYVQGIYLRAQMRPDMSMRATPLFEQALLLDPELAVARAALAEGWISRSFDVPVESRQAQAHARSEAELALKSDAECAQAKLILGQLAYLADHDPRKAEKVFLETLRLAPQLGRLHDAYGLFLLSQSRAEDALRELRQARAVDPAGFGGSLNLGIALMGTRRYSEAVAEATRVLEVEPGAVHAYVVRGICFGVTGRGGAALGDLEKAVAMGGRESAILCRLGAEYARQGRTAQAAAVLGELRSRPSGHTRIALLEAALGHLDQAFQELDLGYASRESELVYLDVDPNFDTLRRDRRLEELRAKIGLPR